MAVSEKTSPAESLRAPPQDGSVTERQLVDDGLPPKDHGWGAWSFLVGACIVEGVTWGFPACFGVFREYFFTHPPFEGQNVIAVVGVMSNGCLQIIVPFCLQLLGHHPSHRKSMMWTGLLLCVASSLGGAFSVTPAQLIVSQGTFYGLGSGMLFAPCLSFMSEWFERRKSLAYGLMCASIGGTGTFLPNIYAIILRKYGHRTMLIGWAVAVGVLTTLALFLIQPRLPKEQLPAPRRTHYRFMWKPLFWLLAVSTVIQGFALNLPGIYIPSYATDTGHGVTKGAVLLSMLNLATAVGQPSMGHLADRLGSIWLPLSLSTVVSGVTCLLLWGFEGYRSSFPALLFVCFLYGGASGGYAVLRTRFSSAIVGDDEPTPEDQNHQTLIVFGVLTLLRGFSNAGSGFVGAALVDESVEVVPGYGVKKWRWLIVFVGLTMVIAAGGAAGKWLMPRREKDAASETSGEGQAEETDDVAARQT